MKTTDHAINAIYDILTGTGGVEIPVYKLRKPTNVEESEYIVINALPIGKGILQKCVVNVNHHASDLAPGIPDIITLGTGSETIMGLLEIVSTSGVLIDFENQEYIPEENINETYSNIRFKVKIINT